MECCVDFIQILSILHYLAYKIYFDFGSYGRQVVQDIEYIDRKTILFRTPSCLSLPSDENFTAMILIEENNRNIGRIGFNYIARMYEN